MAATEDPARVKQVRLQSLGRAKINAYPRFGGAEGESDPLTLLPRTDIAEVRRQWDAAFSSDERGSEPIRLTGRIISIRSSGGKLYFYDLFQNEQHIQIVGSQGDLLHLPEEDRQSAFRRAHRALGRGDIVDMVGVPGRTTAGELSLFLTAPPRLLAPCLHDIPYRTGLKDPEVRFRNRHVDFLLNPSSRNQIFVRAATLKYIRRFLDDRHFTEVETPILSPTAGGANAQPFQTQAIAYGGISLNMRIAPELFLKQLVIGGFDRVYEIGKQFRNEGVDTEHNPEFTTCEFYQAYTTVHDLMDMTESLLSGLVKEVCGTGVIRRVVRTTLDQQGPGDDIHFDRPFRRLHVMATLEEAIGSPLPPLGTKETGPLLAKILADHRIPIPKPATIPKVLDALIGHFVEPLCVQPTFLYGHPTPLSPLAKQAVMDGRPSTARFELFVGGVELANAYEELNDPEEQRRRFRDQLAERKQGDTEAPIPDDAFCYALEYALPPTGGWGLGIDRLCALLAGSRSMRETISFPLMRPITEPEKPSS